jgi:hypothetical protein
MTGRLRSMRSRRARGSAVASWERFVETSCDAPRPYNSLHETSIAFPEKMRYRSCDAIEQHLPRSMSSTA